MALTYEPAGYSERQAIVAATLRNENTLSTFVKETREAGLHIQEIEHHINRPALRCLSSQPDAIGESGNRVKLYSIKTQQ